MLRDSSKYQFKYSFLFWFILLTLNFLFFSILNSSAANQVSLEWDPNSETDLDGYRVFCREQNQSYDYANPSWEGTDNYCTIYNLDETKAYCFVARAFDIEGFESGNSNEVCHEPLVIPDIKANGSDGPVELISGNTLSVTIELEPGSYTGYPAYLWCVANVPFPPWWYYYDGITKQWLPGFKVSYQGPLFEITSSSEVLNTSNLPTGGYTFYFEVYGWRNDRLDEEYLYYDSLAVTIKRP